jgi:hypothetical protein
MNQDQKTKLLELTRAQAERLLSRLTSAPLPEVFQEANGRFDEPAEVLLAHRNYHVRYKAWRALGAPLPASEDAEALFKSLAPGAHAKRVQRQKEHAEGGGAQTYLLHPLEVELAL